MAVIIRAPTIVESPDPTQGGSAVNSPATSGHGSTTVAPFDSPDSLGNPTTERRTCRWRGFQPVSGRVIRLRLMYTWSWNYSISVTVSDQGTAEGSISYFLGSDVFVNDSRSVAGPGPVSDGASDSDGNTSIIELPANTDISTIQLQTELFASANVGILGSDGDAQVQLNAIVSGIQLEVTIDDSRGMIVMM